MVAMGFVPRRGFSRQVSATASLLSKHSQQSGRRPSQLRNFATLSGIRNWFRSNLGNYCNTTSLHGFNYIAVKGISRTERFFWITVVAISIIVSVTLVVVSYVWNRETPTVTVIESSHFPTWNIPFPAVTICNFNKISKRRALQLAKLLYTLNDTTIDFELADSILQMNNMSLQELSDRLSPDCMEMISKCIWKGTAARCDSLFQRIKTTEGQCCSFNYFARRRNNFPEKIAYQIPKRPYRVTGCGYATGLSVLLDPGAEDYMGTYFSSHGFRLLIHDAYNFPDDNAESKVVTSTRESFVRISPESTYATNDIKNMEIDLRDCLFAYERSLVRMMQRYSFTNCMAECRIRMLYQRCGCVPSTLPTNGTYPICEVKQIACVVNNREIFTRALPTLDDTLSIVKDTKTFPCNCLPDCEINQYRSEITMGRLNVNLSMSRINAERNINTDSHILLHVFFSDLMSTRYRMEIFQNWLSSLASFGGLLGLIMGFSIVTLFEFFYFLTFRPVFNYFNDM